MSTIRMRATLCALLFCSMWTVASAQEVKCGIDNLIDTDFALLKGKRVVLVSHAAARSRTGRSTLEEFQRTTSCTLVRALAPEHGYFGVIPAGESVANDTVGGLPVLSLYGARRRPDSAMLANADAVVIDMQDIGVRSYTYVSTMVEVLEACAQWKLPAYILDRPNPIGGTIVDGSIIEDSLRSFVGRLPIPYVHGCTMGELASMANAEGWISAKCSVTVVRCKRWKRSMRWEDTGLPWYPTSPNIPSVDAVRGYAVTGLLGELALCSIGIGTGRPFTTIGDVTWSTDDLHERLAPFGVVALPGRFTPTTGRHKGKTCTGYHLTFSSTVPFKPYQAALTLMYGIVHAYPASVADTAGIASHARMFAKTSGHGALMQMLLTDVAWPQISALGRRGLQDFITLRERYLLYP